MNDECIECYRNELYCERATNNLRYGGSLPCECGICQTGRDISNCGACVLYGGLDGDKEVIKND